ncbi:twin-arginine translocase TatA/TatE family subunit [Brevibacterium permense]|nr:twin-arginine translocase TatA/TatE family subunit [Brevibacterium permense]
MLHNLTGWHALVILAIIILVFGAAKLPALAKSLGQSVRILKDETTEGRSNATGRPDDTDRTAPEPRHFEAVTDPITTYPDPAATSAGDDGNPGPTSASFDPNLGGSIQTNPTNADQTRPRS